MAFAPDGCVPSGLTSLDEALAAIRSQLSLIVKQETVPLPKARSRVLARDLVAGVNLPHSDNSAVDGFAMRAADLIGDAPVTLRLIGQAAAGHPFAGFVGTGEAVRILTGAPLPDGADVIVMQERCNANGSTVEILSYVTGKTNWRPRGEDIGLNARALIAGRRLRPADVALAAALGCKELHVFRRLSVGLFSTGDELREPGETLRSGQIWDANRHLLRCLLEQMGCDVEDFGILHDDPAQLERRLSAAAQEVDLLVTSGGMSVGGEDHMRTIIGRRGTLDIWRIALRPGKPVGIGDIDACPILALPGNPIAAAIALTAIGRTVVDMLSGAAEEPPLSFIMPAGFNFDKRKGFRQYLLGDVTRAPSGASVGLACAKQGSAMLSTMAASSGFIVLAEECERVEAGDLVSFLPLNGLWG
jgi:molybdopterin molybdotransferase